MKSSTIRICHSQMSSNMREYGFPNQQLGVKLHTMGIIPNCLFLSIPSHYSDMVEVKVCRDLKYTLGLTRNRCIIRTMNKETYHLNIHKRTVCNEGTQEINVIWRYCSSLVVLTEFVDTYSKPSIPNHVVSVKKDYILIRFCKYLTTGLSVRILFGFNFNWTMG